MKFFIAFVIIFQSIAFSASALEWHSNQVFYSSALKKNMSYDLITPEGYSTNNVYPVLYMLHGRNQHYSTWRQDSDLKKIMTNQKYQFIIVMPEGEYSWYMDDWMIYISRDLPTWIDANFPTRQRQGIDGISMGGYGAFYIAGQAKEIYDEDYASVASMSGAFVEKYIVDLIDDVEILDPNKIANYLAKTDSLIYFDCGNDDTFTYLGLDYDLAEKNDEMRDLLQGYGRILSKNMWYFRPPGVHDWVYWNSQLPNHLQFHNKCFVDYPEINLTNLKENKTTTITTSVYRVEGTAYAKDGIEYVTWQSKSSGIKYNGLCTGTTNWYVDLTNAVGKNELKFNAYSFSYTNSQVSAAIFLRDYSFKVKKITVKEKSIMAKTSDITNGDIESITNGYGGVGLFELGDFAMPITNLFWKRKGQYNNNYKLKNDDWKVIVKVKGKAQKDLMIFKIKLYNTNLWPHSFLNAVDFNTTNKLKISLGDYGNSTNIFINEKGKYKYNGSWF